MLEKEAAELLALVKTGLVNAGNIAQSQFPLLCRQILAFNFAWAIINMILCFLILAVGIPFGVFLCRKIDAAAGEPTPFWFFLSLFLFPINFFFCNLYAAIQIRVAPILFLIEYLKVFLK